MNKIKDLIQKLNCYTALYDENKSPISDEEWDNMYFKLKELEEKTGLIYPNSPTQKIVYTTVNELKKVKHNHLMLSLDKTKDLKDIDNFLQNYDFIAMAKLDGLTCSLRYLNGELVSAETRGNGEVGEDILHNALVVSSIPKKINYFEELIVDGEIICTYTNFNNFKDVYKNPRNFAAGSIRLLDSKECASRKLTFVVWDVIKGLNNDYLHNRLLKAETLGFTVVPWTGDNSNAKEDIAEIKELSEKASYPIDGVVFKIESQKISEELGHTAHHFNNAIAYKFYDEEYETEVINIEWTEGKSGVLTPVLIYKDITIDGTVCNRASLHNISIMTKLMGGAYPGQRVFIKKANQIIPQVSYAQTNNPNNIPTIKIPNICPYCGNPTEIKKEVESEMLYCTNPDCSGRLINRLDHFTGKRGLDIKGLSKKTLEKLIDWNWIASLKDIFTLKNHKVDWIEKPGFGDASVNKILNAIEESRKCPTEKFLAALGIPLIGKVASVELAKTFKTYSNFRSAIDNKDSKLYNIAGVGEVMINTLLNYDYSEADNIFDNYIIESNIAETQENTSASANLNNKIFVITGKLKTYKNRDELTKVIEANGGKVSGSISSKTSYLINNDTTSSSAKNIKAKSLNIPIISEEEFNSML